MIGRGIRVLAVGGAVVAVVAAITGASRYAPTLARHLWGNVAGTEARTIASTALPAARWSTAVTGWPSALVGDDRGAVVVAGRGEVRAIEPGGGTAWRAEVPGAGLYPPALGPDIVVVGAGDRAVALDRADGSARWAAPAPGAAIGAIALGGDVALIACEDGALAAVDAATGEPRWRARYPGAIRAAPALEQGGRAVALSWHGGDDPRLRALDLDTGDSRWDAPLGRFATAPVVRHGVVVVGEGDGRGSARIVGRSLADGRERWSVAAPAAFESGIVPGGSGDRAAVVDRFGTVTAVDPTTGRVLWRTELDHPVLRTTVLGAGDAVVLTTYGGDVVALDRETGRVRHRGAREGFPVAVAPGSRRGEVLVALRLAQPGRVEALSLG